MTQDEKTMRQALIDLCNAIGVPGARRKTNDELQEAITDWNNEPGRTHAEVLAVIDRAIAIAQAEEAL
jgi:hypothetical protein